MLYVSIATYAGKHQFAPPACVHVNNPSYAHAQWRYGVTSKDHGGSLALLIMHLVCQWPRIDFDPPGTYYKYTYFYNHARLEKLLYIVYCIDII